MPMRNFFAAIANRGRGGAVCPRVITAIGGVLFTFGLFTGGPQDGFAWSIFLVFSGCFLEAVELNNPDPAFQECRLDLGNPFSAVWAGWREMGFFSILAMIAVGGILGALPHLHLMSAVSAA